MASSTVENYLKTLYAMQQVAGEGLIPLGKLAEALSITAGTATIMIKRLATEGYVDYEPRNGAKLTKVGRKKALDVLRRHRLIELFLVEVVKLDWSEVHEEAEILEHAISDRLLQRIDDMLGNPTHDPHGDPIPQPSGEIVERKLISLSSAEPGPATIARISDHSPSFLQFIDEQGLTPNTEISLVSHDLSADTVTITRENQTLQLGRSAASKIMLIDINH
ncbi:metal-dependent transcriptional regulator [Poriferisphaera sp. WC338]|uniref:metal-dependent transcriptional regulator n=1 Tax=Poriferisphaera sp. WC338 TaxID=3425129 RepID=UPI003D8126FD